MISRTRATPSVTAENGSKWRAVWFAMMRASVVFPDPGGPQRMQDPISPRRISSPRAFPGPSRCSWPRNSSRVRGRMRAASGSGERGNRVGSDTDGRSGNGTGEAGCEMRDAGGVRRNCLVDQIRRAAISIPANIAEGYALGSTAQFLRCLKISLGSATELFTHLSLLHALSILPDPEVAQCLEL